MRKSFLRQAAIKGFGLLALGLVLGPRMVSGAWANESSCINCHTDAKMLTANLAVVKEKSSDKQSGLG